MLPVSKHSRASFLWSFFHECFWHRWIHLADYCSSNTLLASPEKLFLGKCLSHVILFPYWFCQSAPKEGQGPHIWKCSRAALCARRWLEKPHPHCSPSHQIFLSGFVSMAFYSLELDKRQWVWQLHIVLFTVNTRRFNSMLGFTIFWQI